MKGSDDPPTRPRGEQPLSRTELGLFLLITAASAAFCAFHETVVLDDAFIYFRVVHNLVDLGRAEINPGDGLVTVTSPLWTLLLALPAKLWPALPVHVVAKALWLSLLALASGFVFLITRRWARRWAPFVAIPFFLSPMINSMMGNEIALLYAALFLTLWACLGGRVVLAGVGLGLGYLARSEFALMVVPVLLQLHLAAPRGGRSAGGAASTLARLALGALPVAAAWHLYYFFAYDNFLPSTFHIKLLQGRSGGWRLYHDAVVPYLRELLDGRVYLLVPILLGVARLRRLSLLLGAYTALHYLAYRQLALPDYHWYHYDFYILTLLWLLFGVGDAFDRVEGFFGGLGRKSSTRAAWRLVGGPLFLLVVLLSVRTDLEPFSGHSWRRLASPAPGHPRLHTYMRVCEQLEGELSPGDVLLAPEIGILGYCLRGQLIRDLSGLATPIEDHRRINDQDHFVLLLEPRFLLIMGGGQPETRFFAQAGRGLTYRRLADTSSADNLFETTLYVRDEEETALTPELLMLSRLRDNARLSPDVHWLQIEGAPGLYCHAPCESTIELEPGIRRIRLVVGFRPDLAEFRKRAARAANGVRAVFAVGTARQPSRHRIVRDLPPFNDKGRPTRTLVTLEPSPGDTQLSIYFDPVDDDLDYDWTYLRVVALKRRPWDE